MLNEATEKLRFPRMTTRSDSSYSFNRVVSVLTSAVSNSMVSK